VSGILRQRIFLGLALAFTVSGGAAPLPEPPATVQVWTYNYAGESSATIARAQREASRVFAHAGVGIEWVDCPPAKEQRELFPRCRLTEHQNPVVLRIFSGKPSRELVSSSHVFGKAYLDDDGNGNLADVYTGGAERLADASPSERNSMLGHLIAHELGHLFLASSAHSFRGIMRSHWSNADLRLALRGGLLFNSRQGEHIARNLRARPLRHAQRGEANLPAQRTVRPRM
jgi:hypothetical protein